MSEQRLTPVSYVGYKLRECGKKTLKSGERKVYHRKVHLYIYSCSCGNFCTKAKIDVDELRTKSCGCLMKEQRINNLNNYRKEAEARGETVGFKKGHKYSKGRPKGITPKNKGKIFLKDKPNHKGKVGNTGRYVTMQELTELYYSKDEYSI